MLGKDLQRFLPLTAGQFNVLLTLSEGVLHGYGVKHAVEERTGGIVRLGAASLYQTIGQLLKKDLVLPADAPPHAGANPRWRFYEITQLGRQVLRAEVSRLEADLACARASLASFDESGAS